MAKGDSTYKRQPTDKITLAECQALIESKVAELKQTDTLPARVSARYALIGAAVALVIAGLAFLVAVVR